MEEKTFNHKKTGTSDKIALVGELEHARRHALRSAVSVEDEEKQFFYLTLAKQLQTIRREYMRTHFGQIADSDWCLCKTAACLRQIAYEVFESNSDELKEIDNLVDEIWGKALGEDLSDCEACKDDREN